MDPPVHAPAPPALLSLRGISKSFGAVAALREVSLDLHIGEVHALVGENGAGKSTLIKVITGAHAPDAGTLEILGEQVQGLTPRRARALGVAVIYQQPALFRELSVAENLLIGSDGPILSWRRRRARARELLASVGADLDPDAPAGELSAAQQQLVEIARALRSEAPVLVLDEPTAVLPGHEAERLLQTILRLRDRGVGVLYISHRLEEVERIASRVSVLRDGRLVWSGTARGPSHRLTRDELIAHMVGRELARRPERARQAGEVALEMRGLGCRDAGLAGISLELRAGEILGLAGLVGAGRSELAQCLFGLRRFDSGEVRVRGVPVRLRSVREALACGIACVPEDRRRHGVIPELDVAENLTLPQLGRLARRGLLDARREQELARDWMQRLGVKAASPRAPLATLSGGNQQKVALARWLAAGPRVLILDEPTQGIDVAGRAEIHRQIEELARQGLAVLLISSDLDEVLELSDRIAVMRRRRLAGVLPGTASAQEVLAQALGAQEAG